MNLLGSSYFTFNLLASQIWKHLESRFNINNGSRKYKLSKDIYALKQSKCSVSEYYIKIRGIWEELDAMNELLVITAISYETATFLSALTKQQQENKLF